MEELFETIWNLEKLEYINIKGMYTHSLSESIKKLSKLEKMDLKKTGII